MGVWNVWLNPYESLGMQPGLVRNRVACVLPNCGPVSPYTGLPPAHAAHDGSATIEYVKYPDLHRQMFVLLVNTRSSVQRSVQRRTRIRIPPVCSCCQGH